MHWNLNIDSIMRIFCSYLKLFVVKNNRTNRLQNFMLREKEKKTITADLIYDVSFELFNNYHLFNRIYNKK